MRTLRRLTVAGVVALLARAGLRTPEQRAWAMYDWANSAFITVIMAAVFPIYYREVAGSGLPAGAATLRFGLITTVALAVVAVIAPILGTLSDSAPIKKRLLALSLGVGLLAVGLMFFIGEGDWLLASFLFVLANIAMNSSLIFSDALLPHVAGESDLDGVSAAGYALGYVGGGVLLAAVLAWLVHPGILGLPAGPEAGPDERTLPTRLAFLAVAAWWLLFSIPLFRGVPEPAVSAPARTAGRGSVLTDSGSRLRESFAELRRYPNGFLMLAAFFLYNDGIGTIIRMAAIYGSELGLDRTVLVASILVTQFVGIPCAVLFGKLAGRIGARNAIYLALAVYSGISLFGYFIRAGWHFLLLAVLVGTVQGGVQALSRSLFASLIPRHKSGQFFGFFAVVEKFAAIAGPAVFALTMAWTGSSRHAVLSVVVFFVAGAALLSRVDVEQGRRQAREAEVLRRVAATDAPR